MTHEELLEEIDFLPLDGLHKWMQPALRAVVELHKPQKRWHDGGFSSQIVCEACSSKDKIDYGITYPCRTIQAIQEQLK